MPDLPRRRSPRLQGYDYSSTGAYFVTLCLRHRESLLLAQEGAGALLETRWAGIPTRFPGCAVDLFVAMPNHVHGIVVFPGQVDRGARDEDPAAASLPGIMHWYKTHTTVDYLAGVRDLGWARFEGRLWQRSYYDHVIRNQKELERIREYIANNPLRWKIDRENPARSGRDDFDVWLETV